MHVDPIMPGTLSDRERRRVERQLWWERNKDKVIAYSIMTGLLVFFVIYLVIAALNGWNLQFN